MSQDEFMSAAKTGRKRICRALTSNGHLANPRLPEELSATSSAPASLADRGNFGLI
jgi:hypothetical protein